MLLGTIDTVPYRILMKMLKLNSGNFYLPNCLHFTHLLIFLLYISLVLSTSSLTFWSTWLCRHRLLRITKHKKYNHHSYFLSLSNVC